MPPLLANDASGEEASDDASGGASARASHRDSASTPSASIAGDEVCIRGSDHGRQMWSAEEDAIIEAGVAEFGCKWRQIAARLNGRSDSSVRNRWMRLCKERQTKREGGADPAAAPPPARPAGRSKGLKRLPTVEVVAAIDDELAAVTGAMGGVEVQNGVPLGLDQPEMLVDLDSFVDAVAGVLQDSQAWELEDSEKRGPPPGPEKRFVDDFAFKVDEACSAKLASQQPKFVLPVAPPPSASPAVSPAVPKFDPHAAPPVLRAAAFASAAVAGAALAAALVRRNSNNSM